MEKSVVRSLGARRSSLLAEAEGRRQRVKLTGWSLLGLIVLFTLGKVVAAMLCEIYGLFWLVSLTPATVKEKDLAEQQKKLGARDLSSITLDKFQPVTDHASAGLELWRNAPAAAVGGGESIKAAAVRLLGEFEGVQDAIREVQSSLAKSSSVGSVVGVVSWDLEQRQAVLKEEQKKVAIQNGEVHALARQIIQEHNNFESLPKDATTEAPPVDSLERERRYQHLRKRLADGLSRFDIKELLARVGKVEDKVEAAVSKEDAEEIATRFLHSSGGRGADGNAVVEDDEISRVVEEVVRSSGPSKATCISVSQATKLTKQELERFGADRTGIPDYAMGPAGARVVSSLTSDTYSPPMPLVDKVRSLGRKSNRQPLSQPAIAITPESHLGRCWPMKGSHGELTIKLVQPIRVEQISIEHASRELLMNKGISAPKDFSVIGYPPGWTAGKHYVGDVLVSGAEYRLEGDAIQFFEVAEEYRGVEYASIALEVESNHGEGAYTCLYRFRVHGTPSATEQY